MLLYSNDGDVAEIDGYKFRRDTRSGYYLSAKPIKNGKRMRLHVYVWEKTVEDDVIRVCTVCGEKFKVNKYAKKRTCSRKCAARLRIKNKAVQNQMREA